YLAATNTAEQRPNLRYLPDWTSGPSICTGRSDRNEERYRWRDFMRRHLMLGTVFSAALAVGAAAQSAGQSPAGQSPAQPPTGQSPTGQDTKGSSAAQTITVTGCLKADTSSPSSAAPGAPANPPASSASAGYILEAAPSGGAANPPSPTATSGSATTYKLSGGSSDLATLVGKKVEVKGTLQSKSGGGGASESGPGSAMGDTGKAQQLRVSSVKEVSGSCSQ